jgi:hypothetical protein
MSLVEGDWTKRVAASLKHSNKVDLEGALIDDLSRLGQPTTMRTLVLSYVQIASISGLKPLPHLDTFIADRSRISSFVNFVAIEGIRSLSLRDTPLSQVPQFTLSAAIVCPRLTSLNGKRISELIRRRANAYPTPGRKLVNLGWFAEFPYPSEDRLSEIAAEFGSPKEGEAQAPAEDVKEEPEDPDKFEGVLAGLWRQHAEIVENARSRCNAQPRSPSDGRQLEEEEAPLS